MTAQELRELLRIKGCQVGTLAKALGIHPRTIERYIYGETPIKPVHSMAIKYFFQIS